MSWTACACQKTASSNLACFQEGEAIDWGDFDMVDSSNIDNLEIDYDMEALKQEIQVEEAGVYIPTDGIAKGDDALYLLEFTGTRYLLLNDLVKVGVVRG